MRFRLLAVALALSSSSAFAQKEVFFGSGKPPVFKETDTDRRFGKSRIAKALSSGTEDPNCVQLLGGLFTALG